MSKVMTSEYGFDVCMPAALVRFENVCSFKEGAKRETHVVSVSSESDDHHTRKLDVYITRAGRLRVYDMTDPKKAREMAVVDEEFDTDHEFNKPVKRLQRKGG